MERITLLGKEDLLKLRLKMEGLWASFEHHARIFYEPLDKLSAASTAAASLLLDGLKEEARLSPLVLLLKAGLLSLASSPSAELEACLQRLVGGFFSPLGAARKERRSVLSRRRLESVYFGVELDPAAMNLLLKYVVKYPWLRQAGCLVHSHFGNMRLFMDKFTEGLKSLNLASKVRAYNELLRISPLEVEDPELLLPLSLFRSNMLFYVQLLEDGYAKSRREAGKSRCEAVRAILASAPPDCSLQVQAELGRGEAELLAVKESIAMNYKSVYLAGKLRDLFIQNGKTMELILPALGRRPGDQVIEAVQLLEVLLALHAMHLFEDGPSAGKFRRYNLRSRDWVARQVGLSTARRAGGLLYQVLDKTGIEFDEVMQAYLHHAKPFFLHPRAACWLARQAILPPLLLSNRLFVPGRQ